MRQLSARPSSLPSQKARIADELRERAVATRPADMRKKGWHCLFTTSTRGQASA
jgi:hypothetical protein